MYCLYILCVYTGISKEPEGVSLFLYQTLWPFDLPAKDMLRQKRRALFCDAGFLPEDPGNVFPRCWTSNFQLEQAQKHPSWPFTTQLVVVFFLNPIFKTTFRPLPHSWSLTIAGQLCNHGTRAFPPDWSRKPWSLAWCSWRWMQTSREWLPRSLMSGANKSLNKLHVTTVLLYHYIVFIFFCQNSWETLKVFFSQYMKMPSLLH